MKRYKRSVRKLSEVETKKIIDESRLVLKMGNFDKHDIAEIDIGEGSYYYGRCMQYMLGAGNNYWNLVGMSREEVIKNAERYYANMHNPNTNKRLMPRWYKYMEDESVLGGSVRRSLKKYKKETRKNETSDTIDTR